MIDKSDIRCIYVLVGASKTRLWVFALASAQKNINLTILENLIVPYCTLDMQVYIVGEIKACLSSEIL